MAVGILNEGETWRSGLHQLAPYIGKLRPAMASHLIQTYTKPGDLVLDPFCGSGVIPVEAALQGRNIVAADISPYAYVLSRGKLEVPATLDEAVARFTRIWNDASNRASLTPLDTVPTWVRSFFHPQTLQEIIVLAEALLRNGEFFLMACLLGILHHQRPGFLSYPASHLVPYLRDKKFPKAEFPELYEPRDIPSRMIAKLQRTYKATLRMPDTVHQECFQGDARSLALNEGTVDAIITSPPYMNALDYGRDNRLRLWFLGVDDHRTIDGPTRRPEFEILMKDIFERIRLWLKPGGYCVLVVGELGKGRSPAVNMGMTLTDLACNRVGGFTLEAQMADSIPDIRRSRKGSLTKREWILVLRRGQGSV